MITGLLMQIAVTLVAARIGSRVCRYLGQPEVVGEMTAGICLGQIGFTWFGSTDALATLSQIGLLLFLFLVGLRVDTGALLRESRVALTISAASIAVPFVLGAGLGLAWYSGTAEGRSRAGFSFFIGAAMAITAFPVLARILRERRLEDSRIGRLAIACAAVDDVAAWVLLAGILAAVRSQGQHRSIGLVLLLLVCYCAAAWFGLNRFAGGWISRSLCARIAGGVRFQYGDRVDRGACFLRCFPGGSGATEAQLRCGVAGKQNRAADHRLVPSAILYADWISRAHHVGTRLAHVGNVSGDRFGCDRRKVGRHGAGGPMDGDDLARRVNDRNSDEHTRPGGVDRVEYRPGSGTDFVPRLFHDGGDGRCDDRYDGTIAETVWSAATRSSRRS